LQAWRQGDIRPGLGAREGASIGGGGGFRAVSMRTAAGAGVISGGTGPISGGAGPVLGGPGQVPRGLGGVHGRGGGVSLTPEGGSRGSS
jgi:hypothetical protein